MVPPVQVTPPAVTATPSSTVPGSDDIFHDDTDIFADLPPKKTKAKTPKAKAPKASLFDDDVGELHVHVQQWSL